MSSASCSVIINCFYYPFADLFLCQFVTMHYYFFTDIGFNLLKQSADIVVLLYVGPETSGLCGEAFHINPLEWDVHIAVMKKSCPVTDYLFGHEVGHLFGCLHNRERHDSHGTAHGFLMRPPVESGYRTIMA